jgi:hypothetical protein
MSTVVSKNVQIGADGTASNNFTIYQPASPDGTLRIGNGNTGTTSAQVVLTSAGNVGIGTSSAGFGDLTVLRQATTSTNATLSLVSGTSGNGRLFFGDAQNSNAEFDGFIQYDQGNRLMQFGTAQAERMRIDSAGNVGIGTSSPSEPLTVVCREASTDGGIGVWNYNSTQKWNIQTGISGLQNSSFTIKDDTANAVRMAIDSSGNLLVGLTSSPQSKVHIRGGNDNTLSIDNDGSRYSTAIWRVNGVYKSGVFYDNTDTRFYVQHNSGGVYLALNATSWTGASDEREKDIIEPIINAAEKVTSLRAVIGKYKTDAEGTRRSFLIAQDVQAVLPEAVDASNPDRLGVAYTDVIPLLVAAIKEQQAIINDLKARLDAANL